MLTNDLIPQYTGERQNEDHWNPLELQMQTIIRPHDNKQYELHSEISYANRHYVYKNHKLKLVINCGQVTELPNCLHQSQYTPYNAL